MVHTSLLMHWCTESAGWTRGLVPALLSFPLLTQEVMDEIMHLSALRSLHLKLKIIPHLSSQMLSRGPLRLEMLGQHYSPCWWDKAYQPH